MAAKKPGVRYLCGVCGTVWVEPKGHKASDPTAAIMGVCDRCRIGPKPSGIRRPEPKL